MADDRNGKPDQRRAVAQRDQELLLGERPNVARRARPGGARADLEGRARAWRRGIAGGGGND
jgi:hypothetical protein